MNLHGLYLRASSSKKLNYLWQFNSILILKLLHHTSTLYQILIEFSQIDTLKLNFLFEFALSSLDNNNDKKYLSLIAKTKLDQIDLLKTQSKNKREKNPSELIRTYQLEFIN